MSPTSFCSFYASRVLACTVHPDIYILSLIRKLLVTFQSLVQLMTFPNNISVNLSFDFLVLMIAFITRFNIKLSFLPNGKI